MKVKRRLATMINTNKKTSSSSERETNTTPEIIEIEKETIYRP
jgi:hypothetical protein